MRLMLSMLVTMLAFAGMSSNAASQPAFRIGLFPFHSPQQLIAQKEPFRKHLARIVGTQVYLETAPSLEIFMKRVAVGEYDVILLPSHFGRLIQQDYRWRPMCKYTPDMMVYLVTRKQGGVASPAAIKGKVVATHDRALLISLVAAEWLKKQGVEEHEFEWLETGGLVNSVYSVIIGQADAAVASSSTLALTSQTELDQLSVLGEAWRVPQPYVLANPKMDQTALSRVRAACRDHVENGGKVFSDIPAAELKSLDRYAAEARKHLLGRAGRGMARNAR